MTSNPSFVLLGPDKVQIQDRKVPSLVDAHSVRVQVKKTGICGSDVHYYKQGKIGRFVVENPMVLGHESSGEIVEVGAEVKTLQVGDRVALEPGIPSRYSDEFKHGIYNHDPDLVFAATPPYDGTLCRYYIMPEDFCYKLPQSVSLEEGALVEPLSVAVHSIRLANVKPGDKVAVFGAGPVGLLVVAVARAFGASEITAVDVFPDRLQMAAKLGASHTSKPEGGDYKSCAEEMQNLIGGPYTVAVDASGAEASVNTAILALGPRGTYIQTGAGKPEVSFPLSEFMIREINAKGSFRYGPGDYKLAIDLIARKLVDVKQIVTHRVPFQEAESAFKLVEAREAIKCVIDGP